MDEQLLLREHYEILANIKSLKEDVAEGRCTYAEMAKRLDQLEDLAKTNNVEHLDFVRNSELTGIRDSLKKLENGTVIMTPQQAKDSGNFWFATILKNPAYLMWLILGVVVITMVFMGYSFVEIQQVLDKIK